jgi:hypothetical protein
VWGTVWYLGLGRVWFWGWEVVWIVAMTRLTRMGGSRSPLRRLSGRSSVRQFLFSLLPSQEEEEGLKTHLVVTPIEHPHFLCCNKMPSLRNHIPPPKAKECFAAQDERVKTAPTWVHFLDQYLLKVFAFSQHGPANDAPKFVDRLSFLCETQTGLSYVTKL